MTDKHKAFLYIWFICFSVTVYLMSIMSKEYVGYMVMAWLLVGSVIGNIILFHAVYWLDKKYSDVAGYNRMYLFSASIIFSRSAIVKAGITDTEDVRKYQLDYRICCLFGGMFVISAIGYGIISVALKLG